MRRIKDVLRLHLVGGVSSRRQLARAAGCGKSAVSDCLRRAAAAGLDRWETIAALDEVELEQRLYPTTSAPIVRKQRPLPDWTRIREELARRDHQVTLALLWTEYKCEHPDGYQYSQFVDLYRRFEKKLSAVLRQQHRAGEKVFVDFCDGLSLVDPGTGELIPTQLFVGALGASSYTFAMATLSQALPVWLDCHVRMYEYMTGVAALTIPDNLRSGVSRPDRYEADINPSYRELAQHYGTCVIPARIRKPRDKAKVEAAVLVAQRWILAALRHRTFYHLNELNAAIGELLVKLNDRVMRHVKQSRRALFERLDRPALKALPAQPYEYAQWGQVRVNIDYHVSVEEHLYSAPYTLIHETLWYRASHRTVELFHQGRRIASHVRSFEKYGFSTEPSHRPASHRAHLEWTPSRLIQWGQSIGTNTAALIEYVIRSKPHPEQGYRSTLGILRLAKKFEPSRLEQACEKALAIQAPSYKAVKTLLEQRMEATPPRGEAAAEDAAAQLGA
ncbi:MAG: IS21 family transposase, partial [Longimicrobiales bacterium]